MATSAGYNTTAAGTDYWVANYKGDSNNNSVSSGVADELVTLIKASPTIGTTQQPATAEVGSPIKDDASLTGLVNASSADTVTFKLYSSATTQDSTTLLFSDTETVTLGSGGTATATSAGYTASTSRTDYWVATFNGDNNNDSATSGAASEPGRDHDHEDGQQQWWPHGQARADSDHLPEYGHQRDGDSPGSRLA